MSDKKRVMSHNYTGWYCNDDHHQMMPHRREGQISADCWKCQKCGKLADDYGYEFILSCEHKNRHSLSEIDGTPIRRKCVDCGENI